MASKQTEIISLSDIVSRLNDIWNSVSILCRDNPTMSNNPEIINIKKYCKLGNNLFIQQPTKEKSLQWDKSLVLDPHGTQLCNLINFIQFIGNENTRNTFKHDLIINNKAETITNKLGWINNYTQKHIHSIIGNKRFPNNNITQLNIKLNIRSDTFIGIAKLPSISTLKDHSPSFIDPNIASLHKHHCIASLHKNAIRNFTGIVTFSGNFYHYGKYIKKLSTIANGSEIDIIVNHISSPSCVEFKLNNKTFIKVDLTEPECCDFYPIFTLSGGNGQIQIGECSKALFSVDVSMSVFQGIYQYLLMMKESEEKMFTMDIAQLIVTFLDL